ncbi:hypothetical protein C8A05DRAFT_13845 [Staphylotrichum tortipilum]|uniref:Uncharacterized protein n=1 Tax=Staphylotrichum tortipilum TaxID=2831512 RepID=A0AAN6MP63_9PEZI|nr:hypothetical protein C8A05DRAFT_13845 [Staphylotrichum longicolle]
MSRLPRLRSLFGSARITSRLPSGQAVRIERVRIKKGKPATRYIGVVLGTAIAFKLMFWVLPSKSEREDGDRNDHRDDHRNGHDDDDDNRMFIGLPLTTERHPPQPYPMDDPAVREFTKISNSKQRRHDIGELMADHVLRAALRSPAFTARWGPDLDIARYSLDLHYPRAAPPEYTRLGILITDHEIALARMPCDPLLAQRLHRIMWPKPLAMGLWSFGTATVKQTSRDVAAYFGFSTDEPNSTQGRSPTPAPQKPGVQRAIEQIGHEATRRPEEVHNSGAMSSSAATPPATASAAQGNKAIGLLGKTGLNQSSSKEASGQEKPRAEDSLIPVASSTTQSWKDFKEAYQRERRFFRPDPVRGSLLVSGTVELLAPRVIVYVDVRAWYDPKTRTYDTQNMNLDVRRIRRR